MVNEYPISVVILKCQSYFEYLIMTQNLNPYVTGFIGLGVILLALLFVKLIERINERQITFSYLVSQIQNFYTKYANCDRNLDKQPSVFVMLHEGLGNRLRVMSSGFLLSKAIGRPLKVRWTNIDMGNTQISDLFEYIPNVQWIDKRPCNVKVFTFLNKAQWLELPNKEKELLNSFNTPEATSLVPVLKEHIANSSFSHVFSGHLLYCHPKYANDKANFHNQRRQFLKSIIPSKGVLNKLKNIEFKLPNNLYENVIGVHIRLTDLCTVIWKRKENCPRLEDYVKQMKIELQNNSKVTFLVCTDDPQQIATIINHFPKQKIILPDKFDRFTLEGQQEAYAELLALSKTMKMIGTTGSTFSSEAAFLNDIPVHWISGRTTP